MLVTKKSWKFWCYLVHFMNVTDSLLGGQYLVTWKCHTLPPKNTSIIGIVIVVVVSISQERVELCCYCIRVCACVLYAVGIYREHFCSLTFSGHSPSFLSFSAPWPDRLLHSKNKPVSNWQFVLQISHVNYKLVFFHDKWLLSHVT